VSGAPNAWTILTLAAASAAACGHSSAPAGPPPTVDEVMEAFVEATGGRAAWDGVTAIRGRGRAEFLPAKLTATIEMTIRKATGKRIHLEVPGAGTMESGVTGDVAWEWSDAEGARILTGLDRKRELLDLEICDELDWHRKYEDGKVVGAADYRGRPAWKLERVDRVGDLEISYYDRDTHLALGGEDESTTGSEPDRTRVVAYADVPPIKFPNVIEMAGRGRTLRITLDTIEINPDLPADVFALPPAVAVLRGEP